MAIVTNATFVVDNRGTRIPAGREVTQKDLGCEKEDIERYLALGLLKSVSGKKSAAKKSGSD